MQNAVLVTHLAAVTAWLESEIKHQQEQIIVLLDSLISSANDHLHADHIKDLETILTATHQLGEIAGNHDVPTHLTPTQAINIFGNQLRNPLNSMIGFSQMMLEQPSIYEEVLLLNNAQRGVVATVLDTSYQILNTVNMVSDYAKLKSNSLEMVMDVSKFDLFTIITEAGDKRPHKHYATWISRLDQTPLMVCADPIRVQQVIQTIWVVLAHIGRHGEVVIVKPPYEGQQTEVAFRTQTSETKLLDDLAACMAHNWLATPSNLKNWHLGLHIARSIVHAQGGTLNYIRRKNGVALVLRLPKTCSD